MRSIGKWLFNVLIGIDQFGNAVLGGDPDETISSRLGKLKRRHGGRIPWHRPLSKVVDWGLERIDRGHSNDSIENDEGGDAVLDRERGKT